jgi:inner membrane protein
MPSPIAHSATGYAIFRLMNHQKRLPMLNRNWQHSFLAIVVANFADLDFIPQILTSERFHRGPSHSMWFAVIVSLGIALTFKVIKGKPFKPLFFYALLLYGSHLLLDFFTGGGNGMLLFWPFSNKLFQAPLTLFPGVHHSQGFLYKEHWVFITFELAYSLILFGGLWALRQRGKQDFIEPKAKTTNHNHGHILIHGHSLTKKSLTKK